MMRSLVRACALFVAVILGTLATRPAAAQTNEAAARALFEEGKSLMAQGQLVDACARLASSQQLDATATTALHLAACYEQRSMFATAWSTFGTAKALAKREKHAERQTFARDKMAAMEKKLARLTIAVGAAIDGLEVTLDGKPVIPAMFGIALPIDPGTHELAATAPGKKAWSKDLVIPADKVDLVEIVPMLEDSDAVPATPPTARPTLRATPEAPLTPSPEPATATPPLPHTSPLAYVGISVGFVGILVGAITGVVAIANTNAIKDECVGDVCPTSQSEAISNAEVVANVSNAMFALGGAGIIAGVIGLFVGGDEDPAKPPVEPMVGPAHLGLRARF